MTATSARALLAVCASVGLHGAVAVAFIVVARPAANPPHPSAAPNATLELVRVDVVSNDTLSLWERAGVREEVRKQPRSARPVARASANAPESSKPIDEAGAAIKPPESNTPTTIASTQPAIAPPQPASPSETPQAMTAVPPESSHSVPGTGGLGALAAASATSGVAGGATTSAASGAAFDPAVLHARLAEAARTCYPPAAKRFRLTGSVPVHFCVDGRGGLSSLERRGTSGSDLLDRAALECVFTQALPLPGPAQCYPVSVVFR